MTKEEIRALSKEFAEMREMVQELSDISIKLHEAAERALCAFRLEGVENGNG